MEGRTSIPGHKLAKAVFGAALGVASSLAPVLAARADEWMSPSEVTVESHDGRFRASIRPTQAILDEETLAVLGHRPARAAVEDLETGRSWTFDLINEWAPVSVLLLADGSLLTFDDWGAYGGENAVVRYDADGRLAWRRGLEEVLPADVLERVPTTLSGREWRPFVLEASGSTGTQDPLSVRVTLWNEDRLVLRVEDGAGRLLHEGQERFALELLDRYFQGIVDSQAGAREVHLAGDQVGRLLARTGRCPAALYYFAAALDAWPAGDHVSAGVYGPCLEESGRAEDALALWSQIADRARQREPAGVYARLLAEAEGEVERLKTSLAATSSAPDP